ncbi:MAG: hypothetical protein ACK4OK_04375, partial [Thermoflexus sp.]
REEMQALEATLMELERRRAQITRQHEEVEAEVSQAREAMAQARAQKEYLEAYVEAFARHQELGEGLHADLQAVLSAGLPGVLGRLTDFLEIEPGWELAAASILGPLLQALVVQSSATLEQVRPLVRHGLPVVVLGALRFERLRAIPARTGHIRRSVLSVRPIALPARPAATILRAREPRLQAWLEGRLAGVWLVETWEKAMALWRQLPRTAQILTRDGERISGEGLLWIGRYSAPEVVWVSRERTWRSLSEQLQAAQEKVHQAERAFQEAWARWKQLQEEMAAIEETRRAVEARRETARRRLWELEEAIRDATHTLQTLEREAAAWEQQRAQIESEQQELIRQAEALAERRRALQEAWVAIGEEIAALGLESIEADLARLRLEERLLEEQRQQLEEMIARHQETLQAVEAEWATWAAQENSGQRAVLEAEREQLQRLQQALALELQELEARRAQGMAALLAAESTFEEAWRQVEDLREAGRALEEQVHAARLEVVRWEGEIHAFQQALREEWRHLGEGEIDLEAWALEHDAAEPLEDLEAEVEALRQALRRLGPINPEAAAEYAELQERHAFLTEQIADLEAAAASLQQTVAALDQRMQ